MIVEKIEYRCDYCPPMVPAVIGIRDKDRVTHACRPCADKVIYSDDDVKEFWAVRDLIFKPGE